MIVNIFCFKSYLNLGWWSVMIHLQRYLIALVALEWLKFISLICLLAYFSRPLGLSFHNIELSFWVIYIYRFGSVCNLGCAGTSLYCIPWKTSCSVEVVYISELCDLWECKSTLEGTEVHQKLLQGMNLIDKNQIIFHRKATWDGEKNMVITHSQILVTKKLIHKKKQKKS